MLTMHGLMTIMKLQGIFFTFWDLFLDISYCAELKRFQHRFLMIVWVTTFILPIVNSVIQACEFSELWAK